MLLMKHQNESMAINCDVPSILLLYGVPVVDCCRIEYAQVLASHNNMHRRNQAGMQVSMHAQLPLMVNARHMCNCHAQQELVETS